MAKSSDASPPTPFETELAEFFGEAPPAAAPPSLCDHVTFRAGDATTPGDAVNDLVRHVRALPKRHPGRFRLRPHVAQGGAVSVRVYWQGGRFHTIRFTGAEGGRLLARHNVAGGRDLSLLLHDWLTASDRFTDIRWRTREQFAAGEPGQAAPE